MKIFTSLRSICMMLLLCAFLSAWAQNVVNKQVQVGDLYYQLYDDATAQVLSSDDYQTLTSVVIPETVSVEGSEYSVTSLDEYAFYGCSSLTSITIPGSVTSISYGAFTYCSSLTSITIPGSVTSIENYAFYGSSSLTNIAIPSSVTSIGKGIFDFCRSLSAIDVDDLNTAYSSIDGVLFNKDQTEIICYPAAKTGQYYSIPTSVTSILLDAFLVNSNLTGVAIPSSVTNISQSAFYWCNNLSAIDVDELNTAYCSIDGVLFNKDQTEIICYPIGKTAQSFTLPNSVTSIGYSAFDFCSNLSAIEAGELNTVYSSIDGVLFNKDQTEIVCFPAGKPDPSYSIPTSVTSVGEGAFFACLNLTSVTIPSSVTSIDDDVFWECDNLTSITCLPTVPPVMEEAFYPEYYTSVTLYVPSASVDAYKTSQYEWSEFTNILPLSEVTHIDLPGTDDASLQPATIYTLDGQRTDGTHSGMYIIRQGGKSRKVLMK